MIKRFCDCCGKEDMCINKFEYKVHLDKIYDGNQMHCHHDTERNTVSDRYETYELCNLCYNEVLYASVKELRDRMENRDESTCTG